MEPSFPHARGMTLSKTAFIRYSVETSKFALTAQSVKVPSCQQREQYSALASPFFSFPKSSGFCMSAPQLVHFFDSIRSSMIGLYHDRSFVSSYIKRYIEISPPTVEMRQSHYQALA